MAGEKFIRTRYEWLKALKSQSITIARLEIEKKVPDALYKAAGTKSSVNSDAFNFSNSVFHNKAIVDTIERLEASGVPPATLEKFIIDLTSSNTYGAFSELSAYRFLLNGNHSFKVQAPMEGASILNPNGSDLDGVLQLPEEVFFDVKGFGFLEHLVNRLTERLSADLKPNQVVAEDSWDVSTDLLNDLLGKSYKPLLEELQNRRRADRNVIRFSVREPSKLTMTEREIDPEALAKENAGYPFRFAKQFVRNKPFFLIFVIHPWFSGSLTVNFGGSLDTFTSQFSKRFFCDFEADSLVLFGLPRRDVARLLSGIIFVDAWEGEETSGGPRYRLFLNPHATNEPTAAAIDAFVTPYGADLIVEQIACV